jgi:HD superfamily phosphohydrolase
MMTAVMGIMMSNLSEQDHFVTPISTTSTPSLDLSIVNSPNIYTNGGTNGGTNDDLNSDTNDEDLSLNRDNLSDTDSSEFISSRDVGLSNHNVGQSNIITSEISVNSTTSTIKRSPMYDTIQLGNKIIYTETRPDLPYRPESFTQYDNIYGSITISNVAKSITTHPYFQRLKNIKQLGPLHFKFPYAVHSRYEHSIGVAYLARYTGILLKGKHQSITDKEILCLELAALCHDLGHGAYSHSFDHLLRDIGFKYKTAHHEVRSQILVRYMIENMIKNTDTILDEHKYLDESAIRLIQYFIDPETYNDIYPNESIPKFTAGLEQIVSNPIHKLDVDKMDYLLRDAQALRFDLTISGDLDIKGLLSRSQIVSDADNKSIWMFHIRDQGTVYDLICRRFIFYNNYYLHPHVNALNCMLTDALKIVDRVYQFSNCAKLETVEDADAYVKLTDEYFLELILNSNDERILGAKDLIQRIVNKKDWYKHLGDFVTNVVNLDETAYAELPWEIFTDKSTPTNLLPKIRYHQNGIAVDPEKITNTRRLYLKE